MSETTAYGRIVKFDGSGTRHKYTIDGLPIRSVTKILGNLLAKNGLMEWPLNTAIKYLQALLDNKQEIALLHLEEAKKQHIILRNKGATTGTTVHRLTESLLHDEQIDLLDHSEEVVKAITGLEHWLAETSPDVVAVEQVVYSCNMDYVGTLDSILRMNGKTYLCDLKTTNAGKDAPQGVYPEHFIQLGAYAAAYKEQQEYELQTDGVSDLVEIDDLMVISAKKTGKVHCVKASDIGLSIEDCIAMWRNVHQLYTALEKVKENLRRNK